MKDETNKWLEYADENLRSAKVLMDNKLFNPCLQNVQQAVENLQTMYSYRRTRKKFGHKSSGTSELSIQKR